MTNSCRWVSTKTHTAQLRLLLLPLRLLTLLVSDLPGLNVIETCDLNNTVQVRNLHFMYNSYHTPDIYINPPIVAQTFTFEPFLSPSPLTSQTDLLHQSQQQCCSRLWPKPVRLRQQGAPQVHPTPWMTWICWARRCCRSPYLQRASRSNGKSAPLIIMYLTFFLLFLFSELPRSSVYYNEL